MSNKWIKVACVALVMVLFAAGCGQAAVPFPTGTYKNGDNSIVFSSKGIFTAYAVGLQADSGTYTEKSNQIVITSDECGTDVPGTYTWSLNGTTLSLTAAGDNCFVRSQILGTGSWAEQP